MSNHKKVRSFLPWFYIKVRGFCWLEDMTALARRYDCADLKIRLRWLKDSTAWTSRFDCVDFKRRIRSSNEALYLIE